MKLKTKELTTCALFAALIAIGAFIKVDIPLPMYTMHFTFQWFFVLMAGFLLGAKLATVSVIVYLSIGLVGVPVFAAGNQSSGDDRRPLQRRKNQQDHLRTLPQDPHDRQQGDP